MEYSTYYNSVFKFWSTILFFLQTNGFEQGLYRLRSPEKYKHFVMILSNSTILVTFFIHTFIVHKTRSVTKHINNILKIDFSANTLVIPYSFRARTRLKFNIYIYKTYSLKHIKYIQLLWKIPIKTLNLKDFYNQLYFLHFFFEKLNRVVSVRIT